MCNLTIHVFKLELYLTFSYFWWVYQLTCLILEYRFFNIFGMWYKFFFCFCRINFGKVNLLAQRISFQTVYTIFFVFQIRGKWRASVKTCTNLHMNNFVHTFLNIHQIFFCISDLTYQWIEKNLINQLKKRHTINQQ